MFSKRPIDAADAIQFELIEFEFKRQNTERDPAESSEIQASGPHIFNGHPRDAGPARISI